MIKIAILLVIIQGLSLAKEYGQILHFQDSMVIIESSPNFRPGFELEVFRTHKGFNIKTGTIKIIQITEQQTLAQITNDNLAKKQFPRYPGIMNGDIWQNPSYILKSKQHTLPEITLNYNKLFIQPRANPSSYELSKSGRKELLKVWEIFGHRRQSKLLIKGFTDSKGDTAKNQVESYQRAATVRQHLIHELGFDGERLIALGLGESDLKDASKIEGAATRNRRIVIKVLDA